jgi:solute:Na+ symporter, SSS family
MPTRKTPLTKEQHVRLLRLSISGVALFAYVFSWLYPPDQPILMFFAVTGAIWLGGAGSVIIGGLYWRKGTTAGAYSALITGGVIGLVGVFIQNIWKKLTGQDFPINGQYINMIAMASAIVMYVVVSLVTGRKLPAYNMDRLLHRGQYAIEGEHIVHDHGIRSRWQQFVGITAEFSKGDRILAIILVVWNAINFLWFVGFTIYNLIQKLFFHRLVPDYVWSTYYFVGLMIVVVLSLPTMVWFTVGGVMDMKLLYKHLDSAVIDETDDGSVADDYHEQAHV